MPVSQQVAAQRQARYGRRMAQASATVPEGSYCYTTLGITRGADGSPATKIKVCPNYKGRRDKPEQSSGYCRLLKVGDYTQGRDAKGNPRSTMLLWDAVKECGVNPGDDRELKVAA